jgi:hypothetical protein
METVQVGAWTVSRNKEGYTCTAQPPAPTGTSGQAFILVVEGGPSQARRSGGGSRNPATRRKPMKVSPFHSKLVGTDRYHDESACTVGDNIEPYNKVSGTGGHPKCHECKRISG